MAKEFVTINTQVATFTAGVYHMTAVLVDYQGNVQQVELGPSTELKVTDYFAPCSECGNAVLMSAWYGKGVADCCARCGIAMSESEPTTCEEAENFLAGCINFFKGGFHPDTLGESYVNRSGDRTFTAEEAIIFNNNMAAAFKHHTNLYRWCMDYATTNLGLGHLYE